MSETSHQKMSQCSIFQHYDLQKSSLHTAVGSLIGPCLLRIFSFITLPPPYFFFVSFFSGEIPARYFSNFISKLKNNKPNLFLVLTCSALLIVNIYPWVFKNSNRLMRCFLFSSRLGMSYFTN